MADVHVRAGSGWRRRSADCSCSQAWTGTPGCVPRPGTEKIITAYADGHEEGIAAYTEAIEESNAAPPDTELLAWGSVMGSQERAAYDACAAALELAFASGELSVGARGWRTKRVDIVNRWLTGRPEG